MTHKNFFIKVIGFVVAVMTSVMAPAETLPMPTHPGNPLVLGNKRVTLITPTLFRLEYAREGRFLDLPTMFAANRDSMMQSGYSKPSTVAVATKSTQARCASFSTTITSLSAR